MAQKISNIGAELNLDIKQGSRFRLALEFRENNAPMNLAGKLIRAHIRKNKDDATPAAVFACNITNAANGLAEAVLGSAQTAALTCGEFIDDEESIYYWDLDIVEGNEATTFFYGVARVYREITKGVSNGN